MALRGARSENSFPREKCTCAPRVTTCRRICAFKCRVEACGLSSQKHRSQIEFYVSTARHKNYCCCKRMCRSDECRAESAAVAIYFEPAEEDDRMREGVQYELDCLTRVCTNSHFCTRTARARSHALTGISHFARKRALVINLCVSCFVPRACGV